MAKRRVGNRDEVMLIPFLDILCSLIGILILIIVVMSVAQTQQVRGRSKEEVALAQKFQSLRARQRKAKQPEDELKAKIAALEKLQAEIRQKEAAVIELRKRLDLSADEAKTNKEAATKLQKQIEQIVLEIQLVQKGIPPLLEDIEKLKKLLAERNKKPDDKPPAIIVRPSGSGGMGGKKLFFVETNGRGLVIQKSKTEKLNILSSAMLADKGFNDFLQNVKNTPNSSLIFLLRKDGYWTYKGAAGHAEGKYGINTTKLPIPGDGEVDLSMFGIK